MSLKTYHQNQLHLIPHTFDDLIPASHPVRLVSQVINRIDSTALLKAYDEIGRPGYHPLMMLKIMVYAYMTNTYSSRKIEKALRENINFMWLSNMTIVDHNTINRFRNSKLELCFKDIFKQIVLMLAEEGLITLKEIYTDGTKLEAQANRYSFVWGKAIKTNKAKMLKQLDELWKYAQQVELGDQEPSTLEITAISSDKIDGVLEQIDENIKKHALELDKKTRKKLDTAKKNFKNRLQEYEAKEKILNGRNSYSKTDHDATFMRMKEDHMKNGQLKAGYNIQISTENQVIVHYSLHQSSTDFATLKPHLEQMRDMYGVEQFKQLKDITADAGYGSEENYQYIESLNIVPYIKYNTFDHERKQKKSKKAQQNLKNRQFLYYNATQDYYVCPMGQHMNKVGEKQSKTSSGFIQRISIYEAKRCEGCSLRSSCHRGQGNRRIERNHQLESYREVIHERLLSEEGIEKRKQRSIDVEPVFGHIKQNRGFRRFTLRGLKKVSLEFGLHALAHNMLKLAA